MARGSPGGEEGTALSTHLLECILFKKRNLGVFKTLINIVTLRLNLLSAGLYFE
jgi:hypothetical protein